MFMTYRPNYFCVYGIKSSIFLFMAYDWFDFCFTAFQHILGHFGRGQLT